MLLNMLIPLVLHVGGGMKNIPKLRNQININVFFYFKSIIASNFLPLVCVFAEGDSLF